MPFCPVCGKDIAQNETFCEVHRPIHVDIKPFDIRLCACGRIFAHNAWVTTNDVEASILKIARDFTKQKVTASLDELLIPDKRRNKGHGKVTINFQGEQYPITFPVKLQICDKCARLGTHYFTAKLQLRNPPVEALPFIEEYMKPLADKGVAINNIEDTPYGPDLYMTHKAVARQLAEKLVRKFGGVMNISAQHFSHDHQTSKDLFRLNVLMEFPKFTIGQVVVVQGNVVLVTGLGKSCTGRNLLLDKKAVFVSGEESEVLKKHKTKITQTHPEIFVMHPITFQSVPVQNKRSSELPADKNVKVVIHNNDVFLV